MRYWWRLSKLNNERAGPTGGMVRHAPTKAGDGGPNNKFIAILVEAL